ncbi:uncharacterized protein LOC124358340 [Homalodisca vitripennis]|uniref:uncharacterized protein LOC124358340 n=1 Tax=Homalodisca vitripennis TaxID=197043 RepID=UPI001EEAC21E|nr:uncharacterized protein LOC124358340 [Homalodisca vitripennis]
MSVSAMSADNKVTTRNSAKSGKPEAPEPASLQSIDDKLNSIINILRKHTDDIQDIKKEQKDLAASIELCHTNISDVKQLVTEQGSKITACEDELVRVNEENQRLWKELKSTKKELSDLEQYSHRNNLIIYGIPEDKNENIQHVMRRLAVTLQFENWSSSLMDAVHRMGKATQTQPRPIIVKFVSRLDKDDFWNKRKVRRNLRATDLGYSSENSIYINESLTPANRELLKMTREAAKQKGYNQVWTTNCSIFVRREKGSPAIKITSSTDLQRM